MGEILLALLSWLAPWALGGAALVVVACWALVAWSERQDICDIDRINRRHGG